MVKVSIKEISSCEKILTVDVPSDEIRQEYESFYENIGKVAKVPGFRPGKVPRNILALHFKEDAKEEVLKKLIPKSLREAFVSKALDPISNPSIEKIDFDQEHLRYDAYIETRPKMKVDKYEGIQVRTKPIVIEDKEIGEILKNIQESRAKFVPVEAREAQIGDFLIVDYVCLVEGKEVEKRSEDMISIKEKDYLEGFSAQLIGIRAGELREVKIKFPENFANKTHAGKEALFQVEVKELKIKELPELNDEFAKESGDFQSLEDLKAKIKLEIETRKKDEQGVEIENALLEELLKRTKFDIPKKMVERRTDALLEEMLHRLSHDGVSEEAQKTERDSLREKLKPDAERQIRVSFLLDEIAAKEKIEVNEKDYELKYEMIANRYRKPVQEIRSHFEKTDSRKDSLTLQITHEKVIQYLKERAVIKTS